VGRSGKCGSPRLFLRAPRPAPLARERRVRGGRTRARREANAGASRRGAPRGGRARQADVRSPARGSRRGAPRRAVPSAAQATSGGPAGVARARARATAPPWRRKALPNNGLGARAPSTRAAARAGPGKGPAPSPKARAVDIARGRSYTVARTVGRGRPPPLGAGGFQGLRNAGAHCAPARGRATSNQR
jgi:hypothetical protein